MKIRTISLALLVALFSVTAQAAKIQCWTDKNGNRMCGDRVPPEYAGKKREIIEDGRVVDTKAGAKTAEELAAEKKAAEEAEEERKRAEYDKSLLQSYRNIQDIETMRDERVAMLDYRLQQAEKSKAESEKTLASLRSRAEKEEREGPKKRLEEQIASFEKSLEEQSAAVERLTKQRDETRTRYDSDAKRYAELRPQAAKQHAELKAKQAEQEAKEAEKEAAKAAKAAEKQAKKKAKAEK